MRLTRTDIYQKFLRNIESVGTADQNIISEFNYQLGAYYQLMLAKLENYRTYINSPFTTAANVQYYPFPPGYVNTDGMVITVGSVNFPLKIIDSEYLWEQLNAITVQASALPQFYYPRRDDFGVWPIPQATYNGQIYYHYRDRNLMVDDYTGGTIAVTSGSPTVTGTGTAFTAAMVGRWFTIDDTTVPGRGYWYRVVAVNVGAQTLTLFQNYTGTTTSGVSQYRIGETPELPEDGHMLLADGVTGGFYKDMRKDPKNAGLFLNSFWTGDVENTDREEGTNRIGGGLISLINRYADRDDTRVINRRPKLNPLQYKVWATSLS